MPAQYDPEVDSWWGIVLTELGLSDPFREGVSAEMLQSWDRKLIRRSRMSPIFS